MTKNYIGKIIKKYSQKLAETSYKRPYNYVKSRRYNIII